MAMSSKKIGKMVSADVDKALANIGTNAPKLDMKDDTIAKATAPKKAQTFAEAFRAARVAGKKNFEWAGKPGTTFTTELASEAKKPAAAAPAKPAASTPTTNTRAQMEMRRTATRSQAAIREKRAENQADFRKRMQAKPNTSTPAKPAAAAKQDYASKYEARAAEKAKQEKATGSAGARARLKDLFGFGAAGDRRAAAAAREMAARKPTSRPLLLTGDAAREANRKQGTIGGKAKGGKIDGAAIRGKTRAPLKKGK